jgi:uncharacterized protein (TIGR02996 family)
MSEAAFLQALREAPDDATPRLVYADWLEERGDPARAEFLRLQPALEGMKPDDPRRLPLEARFRELRSALDPSWVVRVDRSDRWTMLWPNDYCRHVARSGEVGKPLRFLWGGHNRQTEFSYWKVKVGDYIYPVRIHARKLFVIGRMRVGRFETRENYLRSHPTDDRLIREPSADEILVGEGGTPLNLDLAVPREILERVSFRTRRKDRLLSGVEGGELVTPFGLQGVFRLTHRSAQDFDDLLRNARPHGEQGE